MRDKDASILYCYNNFHEIKNPLNALPLIVCIWFQVLFHSPNRGTFHLSLAVLVHYRSQKIFSLGLMVNPTSCQITPRRQYLGKRPNRLTYLSHTRLLLSMVILSSILLLDNEFCNCFFQFTV